MGHPKGGSEGPAPRAASPVGRPILNICPVGTRSREAGLTERAQASRDGTPEGWVRRTGPKGRQSRWPPHFKYMPCRDEKPRSGFDGASASEQRWDTRRVGPKDRPQGPPVPLAAPFL